MAASAIAPPATDFERLFLREYAGVVAAAYRVLGDRADAEDVAQEVFARYARSSSDASPGTLRLAAVRRALNTLRSQRRRVAREVLDFRLDRGARESDPLSDPAALLGRTERQLLVRAALSRMKRRDAELLVLRYSGASYREIASDLHVDERHVGTRLARAEHAFKLEIEREPYR